MPELVVGDVALGLLIDFAPLFGDSGDKFPCDGRTFYFFRFSIAIHDDADKDRDDQPIQSEVERNKK